MKTVKELIDFLATLDENKPIFANGIGIDNNSSTYIGIGLVNLSEDLFEDKGDFYEIRPIFK